MTRLISASIALLFAMTLTIIHPHAQDAQALRVTDAPANAVWLDSLDLSKAPLRRGRGQRGGPPPAGPARGTTPAVQPGVAPPAGVPPAGPPPAAAPPAGAPPAGLGQRGGPPVPLKLLLGGVEY